MSEFDQHPPGSSAIPAVIEQNGRGERSYDIYSRLLKDRTIFIGSEIDDRVANLVVAQLVFLQMEDAQRDVSIYINCPGGSLTAGLAIYDTMQFLTCGVATYCVGVAASMGSFLFAGGTKGKRFALPNSEIMIHQLSGGAEGTPSDIERRFELMLKTKARLIQLLAYHTGQTEQQIRKDSDRDFWMSAEEAQKYGIVDKVVESGKVGCE
jgi:ATP-dependent Clp protease, protease subunit